MRILCCSKRTIFLRFGRDNCLCASLLLRKPRGPPVTVTTPRVASLIRGDCFGEMSYHPPYESPPEAGSTPITGQLLNSFQDSLPFSNPFAFFIFSSNTRWIWPLFAFFPGPCTQT